LIASNKDVPPRTPTLNIPSPIGNKKMTEAVPLIRLTRIH
jgi:hypothetical protein